jgi:hypothetical protein
MLKTVLISFLVVIGIAWLPVSGRPQINRVTRKPAGISQLVENRKGRVTCSGVIIQLRNLRFRDTINPNQIMIREAKHGRDIREMMTWSVDRNGKRLVIRFKPGMGDFGSGNVVEIQIQRSAFTKLGSSGNNHFRWSIDTDIL